MRITKDGLHSLSVYCCLLMALFLYGCNPNTIHFNKLNRPSAVAFPSPAIANIQVINHQVIITGTNLSGVQIFAIKEGTITTPMSIETQSHTSLVANTLSNVTFAAGKVFEFILSNANAASTFTVNFSLCDSDLNGKGFNCSVSPNDKDVLSFDANTNKWVPRNVNGLSYKGTHSAIGGTDPSGSPANGDYYIISDAGTIGTTSYMIGDWIVYNSDDSVWQKISNSQDVLSVFGRTGKVSAKEGDYNLDKLSDVNLTTTPPVTNDVLKYNGTGWVPGTVTLAETDPTVSAFAKTSLPSCSAGQVLRSDGTSITCVASGAFTGTGNRVVTTNASGALTVSGITDTILGYLSTLTGNVQTQLDAKANSASIVDYSVAGMPQVHATRIYGAGTQANKTLVTDATGAITVSAVTPTELGYLSGATSNIQNQLDSLSGAGLWVKTGSDLSYSGGKVGVGVTTPVESIETLGAIKVGTTVSACSAANKGTIRYNTATNVLEFCNGTSWSLVQANACSDASPNVFSFSNEANASTSTLYTSNIVQISGINCLVPVTISGTGSPQYQICNDSSCATVVQSWTSAPSNISSGQYIQSRLTTDTVGGSTFEATIIIGSGATVWSVTTTGDCSSSPMPGTVCLDGTIYAGNSPDTGAPMYVTRCDAGQTWNGVACTGTALLTNFNNGSGTFISSGSVNDTTGRANTTYLSGLSDSNSPYSAANYCQSLTANGYTDWYLPAKTEITIMYSNRAVIKNFSNNFYWTSTEPGLSYGFAMNMSSGSTTNRFKNDSALIRCVRR